MPKFSPPKGLLVEGSRATEVTLTLTDEICASPAFKQRVEIRAMSMSEFIDSRGSGTLRKNRSIGMNVSSHYLHERVAYEFGYAFEVLPERFVTWGEARSEGDCKPLTEAGWHIERYASVCLFPGDEMECKYLIVEVDGKRREGVGIVIRKTSARWIPPGYMVFAIVAEYSPSAHDFLPAVNPC